MQQTGSFQLIKKMNRRMVLRLILDHEGISRSELAEITALSPATVTNVVRDLLQRGLVRETREGQSSGGRRPILLEIKDDGAYVIGIEWGISDISGMLINLEGDKITFSREIVESNCVDRFLEITHNLVADFKNRVFRPDKIFGIGLGVHGLVDPQKGYSRYAPHFQWTNEPLQDLLEERIDYPIKIDNDVRMRARTEIWQGREDFVYINTGPGIGAAVVFEGTLHYGHDFSAGELGHMTIDVEGPPCSCGNRGCLEALVSLEKIVRNFYPDYDAESFLVLEEKWENIVSRAERGGEQAVEILKEAGYYLGTGIASMINLLNPGAVIVGGSLMAAQDIILPEIKKQVQKRALPVSRNSVKILSDKQGLEAGARGAGTAVLEELFNLEGGK